MILILSSYSYIYSSEKSTKNKNLNTEKASLEKNKTKHNKISGLPEKKKIQSKDKNKKKVNVKSGESGKIADKKVSGNKKKNSTKEKVIAKKKVTYTKSKKNAVRKEGDKNKKDKTQSKKKNVTVKPKSDKSAPEKVTNKTGKVLPDNNDESIQGKKTTSKDVPSINKGIKSETENSSVIKKSEPDKKSSQQKSEPQISKELKTKTVKSIPIKEKNGIQNSKLKKQEIKIISIIDSVTTDKDGKKQAQKKITRVGNKEHDTLNSSLPQTEDSTDKEVRETKKKMRSKAFEVLLSDTLSRGLIYKKIKIGSSKEKILIHVVEADLTNPNIGLSMLKGRENSSELEKLHDMAKRYTEKTGENVPAVVNGSFWKAFYNYPMGPTVINGEVVEMTAYKSWPSAFFDDKNKVHIDNFKLTGTLTFGKLKYNISKVNRRTDSSGICLYNKYVGDSVPYISKRMVSRAFEDALLDSAFRDITDREFDTASFKGMLLKLERDSSIELNMKKIIAKYIDDPAINKDIRCVVEGIADTGLVQVPTGGIVLTIGYDLGSIPLKIGEIFTLRYSTDKKLKTVFMNSVCGTPRLIQSGRSLFEGPQKRNRSRFKWEELPRTGIGTNKSGDKLFLIAASPTYKSIGVKGCTLENFAFAMKKLKIHEAVNLDGGGSSVMLINGRNVLSCPECSRRLSIGLGITVKNNLSDIQE